MATSAQVQRIAAFSDGNVGGNPAGVLISDSLPDAAEMQRIAADIGFSETAFAAPQNGDGVFSLALNDARITVEGHRDGDRFSAALQSPPTRTSVMPAPLVDAILDLFGYTVADLDPRFPVCRIHAGADHLALVLKSREKLSAMKYELAAGRALMNLAGLVTVVIAWPETDQRFHTRNPFASGGVYEDPATGAGTAAFAAYLRDIGWPHGGAIDVVQGEDMGSRSLLHAEIPAEPGSSIRVSGSARLM